MSKSATNMRGNSQEYSDEEWEMIQDLYKPEDLNVRKTIYELESSMYRSQTGLRSNPYHIVPYENHPFERLQHSIETSFENFNASQHHDRSLQQLDESEYRPIRITPILEALDNVRSLSNFKQISFIETVVIPQTIQFWSSAIRVIPVVGNLVMEMSELKQSRYCGDVELSRVPISHFTTGVPDSDLLLYISATTSPRLCGPRTLAAAISCNFDQYDRPTAGAINFCLDQIEVDDDGFATEEFTKKIVDVAIHEVVHVLGMSSNSFPFFYDPDTGLPRTKRPFRKKDVICVDGKRRFGVFPSKRTINFFTDKYNKRYAAIVTPKALTVARNQFNCQELQGVPLENQPTAIGSCIGDHWEERLFFPETLSAIKSPTQGILSPLTLALLEDSGWYQANYSLAQVSPWGHGAGCEFAHGRCIDIMDDGKPQVPDYARGYFCDKLKERGCSSTHTHKLACTVVDFSLFFPFQPIPSEYQYFPKEDTKGGPEQVDYCPIYGFTFAGKKVHALDCQKEEHEGLINLFAEERGQDSKCFETTTGEGRCYTTHCIRSEQVLKVRIRGEWKTCEFDFQEIDIRSNTGLLQGSLICPRLSSVCPDMFCPANCSGRGICDFQAIRNGITKPRCKCSRNVDKSVGCSETVKFSTSSLYLETSESLIDNKKGQFIDSLLNVFSSHHRMWKGGSWIWATVIGVVFILMILCSVLTCFPSCFQKLEKEKISKNVEDSNKVEESEGNGDNTEELSSKGNGFQETTDVQKQIRRNNNDGSMNEQRNRPTKRVLNRSKSLTEVLISKGNGLQKNTDVQKQIRRNSYNGNMNEQRSLPPKRAIYRSRSKSFL